MSNSSKMTVEEKLVQHLKESALAALIPDEDALTELTKRAVTEALFKDREKPGPNTWSSEIPIPSPAVAAAEVVAERIAEATIDALVWDFRNDPRFEAYVRDAFAAALPKAIENKARGLFDQTIEQAVTTSFNRLNDFVRGGGRIG